MTVKGRHHTRHNSHSDYDLSADVEKIKAALFDTTYDLKGRASEVLNDSITNVKDQSMMARDNVADYTADKPFKALGIALAAGIVLGWLIKR